jgi:hypothetical protein
MPFFAGKGYDSYAVSLRGTSGTVPPLDDNQQVCAVHFI